jgi:hypothetical protein
MDQKPLEAHHRYLLKHTSHTVPAYVTSLKYRMDIATLDHVPAETLEMNGIGVVEIRLPRPIAVDPYRENRGTGAFILIDPMTNSTVAAGMVREALERDEAFANAGPVKDEERLRRWGHRGGVLHLEGAAELIDRVERVLFANGGVTVRLTGTAEESLRERLVEAGVLVLVANPANYEQLRAGVGATEIVVDAEDTAAVAGVLDLLERTGILATHDRAGSEYSI